jgi:hypothetical protein
MSKLKGVQCMRAEEAYRSRAIAFLEAAETAGSEQKAKLVDMALSYLRLAELAAKNSLTDVVYETPSPSPLATP